MSGLSVRRAALGTAVLFFANGVTLSSWVPRIPEIRDRLALSDDQLGLVLLGLGLGGLIGSVASGFVVDHAGSRRSAIGAGVLLSLGVPLIAVAPTGAALGAVLVGLGCVDAITDISMNTQAVQVQERQSKSVINRFHAVWSLGTLVGAGIGTGAAALDVGLGWQLVGVAVAVAAAQLWARPRLWPTDAHRPGVRRMGALGPLALLLGLTALAAGVVESAPADWSAVFLTDELAASSGSAGLGFVVFTAAMLAGRLAADPVLDRLGEARTGLVASVIIAAGLILVATAPAIGVAVVGFGLMGLGGAALFPLLYLAAGSLAGVSRGAGIATMSTGARIGFMISAPLIGVLSEAAGLRVALGVVVGAALAVGIAARAASFTTRRTGASLR